MVEFAVIANVTDVPVPEAGMLPEPVQPVQTYRVPVPPETGEVTDSVISVPVLKKPLGGEGEPWAEVTVR
jgi:hypothetical protein